MTMPLVGAQGTCRCYHKLARSCAKQVIDIARTCARRGSYKKLQVVVLVVGSAVVEVRWQLGT